MIGHEYYLGDAVALSFVFYCEEAGATMAVLARLQDTVCTSKSQNRRSLADEASKKCASPKSQTLTLWIFQRL
jgi:hypothetical protein